MRAIICILLCFLISFKGICQLSQDQEKVIDSLKSIIKSSANDTLKINAYKAWDDLIYNFDTKLDEELNRKIIALSENNLKKSNLTSSEKYFYKKGVVSGYNTLAVISMYQGDLIKSFDFHTKSLKLAEEINDKKAMANSLNNIGAIYEQKGNYPKAIEYYTKSLKLREEIGDESGSALTLNNIGVIYYDMGDYDKSMDYHNKSLKIRKAKGDKTGIAMSLNNIGSVYHFQKKPDIAIDYFKQGLEIQMELNDKTAIALSLNNIGAIYQEKQDYEMAMIYFLQSLEAVQHIEYSQGMAMTLNNIGNIHYNLGNYEKAFEYNLKALKVAKKSSSSLMIKDAANSLYKYYKKVGKYNEALEMHELYIKTGDSTQNEKNKKAVMKQEMQYNYEKQKALDEKEHEKQIAVSTEQKNKQRTLTYVTTAGLVLVLLFAIFAFNRLRITRKQKNIIEEQKNLVEEKQKEILSSISYAKRLQDAILPPDYLVRDKLPETFILYQPKDIVAGDFYWMETVKTNEFKNNLILIAAADCTGHGVPGAMVSVVCSNALNRAVLEFGITDPGKILDKTRELVFQTFSKSDRDVKDGMDISLASINKTTGEVKWAGANNPLWYISKGELVEIRATKQTIGKADNPQPYVTHNIPLLKGDSLILFTDGFADQFGGKKMKKFKYKPLQDIILKNIHLSSEEQKQKLKKVFDDWKGNLEQVDDVCIIGIRI